MTIALQLAIRHPDLVLVEKLKQLDVTPFAWPEDDIRGIAAPTLIVLGDSDGVRLEHAVELFGLLCGGVMGDLAGMPKSQLAVLPGTAHFVPPGFGLLDRAEWLLAMIPPFLDAPVPEGQTPISDGQLVRSQPLAERLGGPLGRLVFGVDHVTLKRPQLSELVPETLDDARLAEPAGRATSGAPQADVQRRTKDGVADRVPRLPQVIT